MSESKTINTSTRKLIWVDLEMTGLNLDKERIIELACIITDYDLNVISEYGPVIINQPDEILNNMGEWCTEHHGKSGLTEAVRNSKITQEQAASDFLAFIKSHVDSMKGFLAGNSVHADAKFLERYMPKIIKYLHYRIVDVSSIKILVEHWYRGKKVMGTQPKKGLGHRAIDDIRESLEELKFYRDSLFKNPDDFKDIL